MGTNASEKKISRHTMARCPIFFIGAPNSIPSVSLGSRNALIPRERRLESVLAKTT